MTGIECFPTTTGWRKIALLPDTRTKQLLPQSFRTVNLFSEKR
ncbi:hypothetical protein CU011_1403 [Enterococcus faecium]|nr:hypothetical protein [Enterococcus faecium]MBK4763648.1 hypothetical protein [Enterococcus faecium]MBK4777202.1 hypothetical protein [Enterococcus faecium]MBK4790668.1 hypothetical protein [Enterococcus faecium]MBK4832463.1 hypothetical protein [Enterococcus faecium]